MCSKGFVAILLERVSNGLRVGLAVISGESGHEILNGQQNQSGTGLEFIVSYFSLHFNESRGRGQSVRLFELKLCVLRKIILLWPYAKLWLGVGCGKRSS